MNSKMRPALYFIFITISFLSCNKHKATSDIASIDTIRIEPGNETDDINTPYQENPTTQTGTSNSEIVLPGDSLFVDMDLDLKEITKSDFEKYNKTQEANCTIDSTNFISGYGLTVTSECDEICTAYLVETSSGKKMPLPTDYDSGISGMLFSPSCNQFLVYSSCDGPDYSNYYMYRAEIFWFTITKDEGLKAVRPSFKFLTKDWSIEDLTWITDQTVAIKVYSEDRNGKAPDHYKYFKGSMKSGH